MNTDRKQKKEQIFRLLKVAHVIVTAAAFFAVWLLFRYGSFAKVDFKVKGFRYNYLTFVVFWLLLYFFNKTFNSFLLGYSRIRELVRSQIISQFFSVIIIYMCTAVAWMQLHKPSLFVALLVFYLIIDIVWSYYANKIFYAFTPQKKTVIVYKNQTDLRRLKTLRGKPTDRLFSVPELICCNGQKFSEIKDQLDGFEAIFVCGIDSQCRNAILKYCVENGVDGYFLPHIGDVIMRGASHIQSFSAPVVYTSRKILSPEYRFVKRAFDIAASLCGIIVLSPLMVVTAIAIKAYDHGPAIYKQTRLTKDGKEFKILKFRSMRVDAEKDGVARLSTGEADPRITPIGRIVRKCRLDELPQLFNIMKGDMSVVGPRPERPEIAEKYYKTLPDFKLRLQVRAGLTGYAQVYGKYNTEPYEKLEFDLLYINRMSIMTDLHLMFATFGILFSKESTEGVEDPKQWLTDE